MRVFVTKWFGRFARKEGLTGDQLCEAVRRAEPASIHADLGGGVIKQRVGRTGKGRSGGYRTLIAYRRAQRSVFLFGFAKKERDNIDPQELKALKKLAARLLAFDDDEIQKALHAKELKELSFNEESN